MKAKKIGIGVVLGIGFGGGFFDECKCRRRLVHVYD